MKSDQMAWFHEARFGMFIHWGLYSVLKSGEWVMHQDAISVSKYERLIPRFRPAPDCAREWARLARQAGMRYVVFTTKHLDGFCMFATKLTWYNSVCSGAHRDYTREVVEAFRSEGLHVGLYYSIGDWHYPAHRSMVAGDGSRVKQVRQYVHGHVRELAANYQPDILWYDGAFYDGKRFTVKTMDVASLNAMARQLRPGILINERSGTKEDYVTCENECKPAPYGEDWEMCTCINDIWGYCEHDYNYKTVNQLIFLLVNCATQGGNLLLNIGPRGDGSVPVEQVKRLQAVGRWLDVHGESVYGTERFRRAFFGYGRVTRKGHRLYFHILYWPGETMRIPRLESDMLGGEAGRVKIRAMLLTTGQRVKTRWDGSTLVICGLPSAPPDKADSVLAVDVLG